MRPIKFRAQTLNGIWFRWDLFSKIQMMELKEAIKEETVGQFTGLLDKNGTEIYEGDILRCSEKMLSRESIHGDHYYDMKWTEPVVFKRGSFLCKYYLDDIKDKEVIGNIYEHPDLITKTNTNEETTEKVSK